MILLAIQRQFHAGLLETAAETAKPATSPFERGFGIYRNAYRARLVACLRESYERVWSWIGDDAFDRAAIHHLISHPPRSWTLDDAGVGFADTLAELFPDEPEVAELANLEWQMQLAFKSHDEQPITPERFTDLTNEFGEAEWENMRLRISASAVLQPIATNCAEIWQAIARTEPWTGEIALEKPATILIWRQDLQPQFRVMPPLEADALALALGNATFAAICAASGSPDTVPEIGEMLGRWIVEGLVIGIS
ncbi:putative DNA-binding domain-containing protein [Novosphingobium aquiterrae]|uniref:DNA-binding domain-containing protein n=1 Tax=Novosphingobium aquiterrae TaxID=624388 RepID=A0ABV6PGU1_9SPHN